MGPFIVHVVVAGAASLGSAVAGGFLGMDGDPILFVVVIVGAMLTGTFMASRVDPAWATWVWVPAGLWFAGWAVPNFGDENFGQAFIGNGYCGDVACAGQFLVTAPFVGSVAYALGVRSSKARFTPARSRRAPTTDAFIGPFLKHLFVALVVACGSAIVAAIIGLGGHVALLGLVVVAAVLTGAYMASVVDPTKATWVWIPATIWFAAWSILGGVDLLSMVERDGSDAYAIARAGQLLVTAPFVGSVAYALAVRTAARSVKFDPDTGPPEEPTT